ncbi:type II toxin-antitoxin system RelB/DinJ family antitoxin [Pasteurellaceae bacterium LIM206]|nr:type II toxin-antitoxin system RelB/DinJ family antitoxin [Pasteurellaceae bacterium LIM206]
MGYTNFNMRLDNELRASAYPVFEQYGLTPSQAVRMFFNQVAKTGKLPLSLDFGYAPINHEKNPVTMQAVAEVESGKTLPCADFNDFLKDVKNEKY